jgi:CRISPR-associated endoribonuclease Cas6
MVLLEPTSATAVPPPQTGPAVNAAFLKAVDSLDPALAKELHDCPRYKPFTVSPVLGEDGRAPTVPGQPARFAVSLLADRYLAVVLAALHAQSALPVQIARTAYRVVGVEVRTRSYADLADRARADPVEWTFELLSAVGFATSLGDGARREHPWPDADRVFGNLARRWAAFGTDAPLPAGVGAAITDHLETVDGCVSIVRHLVLPGQRNPDHRFRRGSVGTVRYRLAAPDGLPADVRAAVDALAAFAEYAGFGDRTAMGMGHVRLRREPGPPAPTA